MKKFYSLSICLALFFSVLIVGNLEAASYYIHGANGSDSNPGTIASPWKTISKANSTLKAGNIVYIRAGTYREQICPKNSGSSGNYITYQRYPGDPKYSVIISTSSHGASLLNKNYITIDGLYFYGCGGRWMEFNDADYNLIQNCKFESSQKFSGIRVKNLSDYNQFIDNLFVDSERANDGTYWDAECEAAYQAQTEYPNDCDRYTAPAEFIQVQSGWGNKFEGSIFGNVSHTALQLLTYYTSPQQDGGKTIVRNNTFNNNMHHNMSAIKNHHCLVEGNIIKNAGYLKILNPNQRDRTSTVGGGVYNFTDGGIIRKNKIFNNDLGYYFGATTSGGTTNHQMFYNNSLYNNTWQVYHGNDGHNINYNNNMLTNNIFEEDPADFTAHDMNNFNFSSSVPRDNGFNDVVNYSDGGTQTNYYVNNLWGGVADDIFFKDTSSATKTLAQVKSAYPIEWDSSNFKGNPKFSDAANTDFTLQKGSDAIDAGAWLTKITSSTASGVSSFIVANSRYFYDGWGIPGETGDIIKTQNGAVTSIKSINYDTHTITVSPAIDIAKGEGLALNYYGSAPEIGTYEYRVSDMLSPPNGLVIKVSQN